MLTTADILERLDRRGVRNTDIARALGLGLSRVTELKRGDRALKLDEAVKLVEAFQLEQDPQAEPLPPAVLRLLVRYVALDLGVPEDRTEERLAELTEDLRAFSEFVADPKVRRSIDQAEAFFRAMALRRPRTESEARQGSDRASTR